MHPVNEQCFHYFAEILRTLKSTNRHEQVISLLVDRLVRTLQCQTCAVVVIDPGTEYLRIDNCHNLSLTFCNSFRRRIATSAIGQLLWTGKPILVTDSALEPEKAAEVMLEHAFGSAACVQVSVDQRTLGYLHVDSKEIGAFTGEDIEILNVFADIAGLAMMKSSLYEENLRLDRVDHETGLEKYVPWLEKVKTAMERAEEFSEHFAVLILDIDNFKDTVNTYGYASSRQLLKEMGTLVNNMLRPVDAGGRYGFDEFVVLLANTGLEGAVEFAQKMRQQIAQHTYTARQIASTVSIGVAAFPRNGNSIETLLVTAKKALFEAQRGGRNTVHSYKSEWYARTMEGSIA